MTALFDVADLAMRLGTSRGRVTEALKADPLRYGAFKQRGRGRWSYRERWRVPRESLELLRADLKHGRSLA